MVIWVRVLQLDWYPKVKGRPSKGGIEADSYGSPSELTHPESIEEEWEETLETLGA